MPGLRAGRVKNRQMWFLPALRKVVVWAGAHKKFMLHAAQAAIVWVGAIAASNSRLQEDL